LGSAPGQNVCEQVFKLGQAQAGHGKEDLPMATQLIVAENHAVQYTTQYLYCEG
jgi:hypothetical protein